MFGTDLGVGVYNVDSFQLPAFTVNGQDFEITNWGEGVAKAIIVVAKWDSTASAIGRSLDKPSTQHLPATGTISIFRWDKDGNKISG